MEQINSFRAKKSNCNFFFKYQCIISLIKKNQTHKWRNCVIYHLLFWGWLFGLLRCLKFRARLIEICYKSWNIKCWKNSVATGLGKIVKTDHSLSHICLSSLMNVLWSGMSHKAHSYQQITNWWLGLHQTWLGGLVDLISMRLIILICNQ